MKNEKYDYEMIFDDDYQLEVDREEMTVQFINNKNCQNYIYLTTDKGLSKLKGQLKKLELSSFTAMFNSLQREFAV